MEGGARRISYQALEYLLPGQARLDRTYQ
jgi:hypothetical protein